MVLKSENGFTLVELAISLVIIGILIGGILKGGELLENSRLTALSTQAIRYESAMHGFKNIYGALPGDIRDPARIQKCSGYCAGAGNGDGRILVNDNNNHVVGPSSSESHRVWVQLQRAGLISDVSGPLAAPSAPIRGVDFPATKIRGGILDIHFNTLESPQSPLPDFAHYLKTRYYAMPRQFGWHLLTQSQAGKLDIKMDDGKPQSGKVIGWRHSGSNVVLCNSAYDLTDSSVKCDVSIKMEF